MAQPHIHPVSLCLGLPQLSVKPLQLPVKVTKNLGAVLLLYLSNFLPLHVHHELGGFVKLSTLEHSSLVELRQTVVVAVEHVHHLGRETLAQRQRLGGPGSTGHTARLGGGAGAPEAEDAAAAGDDHPDWGGRGKEASSAPVAVNPEQMRALVFRGGHHENSWIMLTTIINS